MQGLNTEFINNPLKLLTTMPINVSSIIEQTIGGGVPTIDKAKYGSFDIRGDGGQAWLKQLPGAAMPKSDSPLLAYWCPFAQGMGPSGFVDIPRNNPKTEFVFTAAMNGCSLLVTPSPAGNAFFRLTHHQHPGTKKHRDSINKKGNIQESDIVFEFDEGTYDSPPTKGSFYQCFNFLMFSSGSWTLYSQYTKLVITAGGTSSARTAISTASLDPSRSILIVDLPV